MFASVRSRLMLAVTGMCEGTHCSFGSQIVRRDGRKRSFVCLISGAQALLIANRTGSVIGLRQ